MNSRPKISHVGHFGTSEGRFALSVAEEIVDSEPVRTELERPRIRTWVHGFSSSFIYLTGT